MLDKSLVGALPTCIESERILLGSLLLNSEMYPEIADKINPSDFALIEHKLIFKAMVDCYTAIKHFNSQKIAENLTSQGLMEKVGESTLLKLEEMLAPEQSLKQYADFIKHVSNSRSKLEDISDLASIIKNVNDKDQEARARQILERLLNEKNTRIQTDFVDFKSALKETLSVLMSPFSSKCSSTFQSIDKLIGGFYNKDMIVIGARPSMGKTALVVTIIKNLIVNGYAVGFFSAEMSRVNIVIRILVQLTGINFRKIKEWSLNSEEEATFLNIFNDQSVMNLYINERTRNIYDVKKEARYLKQKYNINILFIDYLQRLCANGKRDNLEMALISSELKSLATELDIPIVCLSQLNRGVESRADKHPMMSDLRDSGGIEQDADVIMLLYRDEYYNPETQTPNQLEILITKNRNDQIGKTTLFFEKELMSFQEITWIE